MLILCQKKDTIVNLEKVQAINIHLQNRKEVCAWFDVNENNRNYVNTNLNNCFKEVFRNMSED